MSSSSSVRSSLSSEFDFPKLAISNPKWAEYFSVCSSVAHSAGEVLLRAFSHPHVVSSKSSSIDIVTETDKQCESIIINGVKERFPHHRFIAEESHSGDGHYEVTDEVTWVIDPIDGTNNFVHGLPFSCVAIGVMEGKEVVVAIVHCPTLRETFYAVRGEGAYRDTYTHSDTPARTPPTPPFPYRLLTSAPLLPSSVRTFDKAAILTEMGYDRTPEGLNLMMAKLQTLASLRAQTVRMFGSCALNMCSVAMGRADLFYEGVSNIVGPKPWDLAAPSLIVREAGGILMDPHTGGEMSLWNGRVLAAATKELADQCIEAFRTIPQLAEANKASASKL